MRSKLFFKHVLVLVCFLSLSLSSCIPGQAGVVPTATPLPQPTEIFLKVLESTLVPTGVNDATELFSSDLLDLCFSYPQGYTQIPYNDAVQIAAPDLPDSGVKGLFWLEISDSLDHTAEEIADQELTNLTGLNIDRWTVTLGGEQAVVLDGMPGQELQRRVYAVHAQTLYVLAFWPARSENKAAGDQMESLYTTITDSWAWSPCPASE